MISHRPGGRGLSGGYLYNLPDLTLDACMCQSGWMPRSAGVGFVLAQFVADIERQGRLLKNSDWGGAS